MKLQEIKTRTHNLDYSLNEWEQFAADVIIAHLTGEAEEKAAEEIRSIMGPSENGLIEIRGKVLAPWYDKVLREQYGKYMDAKTDNPALQAIGVFLRGYQGEQLVKNLSYTMAEFLHDCYAALQ